VDVTISLSEVR